MALNIIDTVKQYFNSDILSKAGSFLGENENSVSKAMSGIIPVVFSGLISKASTPGSPGTNEVLSLAKDSYSSGVLNNLGNNFSGGGLLDKGIGLVQSLFGDRLNGIISSIASFAGIKTSSASSLFNMAAPVALASTGKYAIENNLDSSGFASFLASQRSNVSAMLPAELSGLSTVLNPVRTTDSVSPVINHPRPNDTTSTRYVADKTERPRRSGGGWIIWLLLLLLAGLAAWYFLFDGKSACTNSDAVTDDTTVVTNNLPDTATTVTNPTTTTTTSRTLTKVRLPNGTELDAYPGGIEDRLVSFLASNWQSLSADSLKNTWFDFDDLNFTTGSAQITAESQRQVNNIAAILKAHPNAKIKIGGYTDKTGNEEANKKLSGERAEAVKAALVSAGVGNQVEGAEGYGSAFATYPADAPEADRVKDRHVSVSVRK